HGACFLTAMNAKTTFFRHLTSTYRKLLCALSALCFFTAGSPAVADPVTLPDLLIGVTQGFLEFTVEDYLATSHTEGRYEIQINQGYLTSVDQAIGQKLVRPIVSDQVITLVHMEQAEVVRKGDQVVISVRSGTLNVRMPGEALSNGGLSEQIRVKNLNSQRIIKARVTAPGQVDVAM